MTQFRTDPLTGAPYQPAPERPSMLIVFAVIALISGGVGYVVGALTAVLS